MSTEKAFYHVYSTTVHGCNLTEAADAEARRTWLCGECHSPKPDVAVINIELRETPGSEALNAAIGWWVPVARRVYLDALGADSVRRDLYLGRVYGPDGQEFIDCITFRGKRRLIVRGREHVSYRRCPQCGRDIYFAMGTPYLYPAPPDDVGLFESDKCGLIMTEAVFRQGNVDSWPGIEFEKLPVKRAPLDSLGELTHA